MDKIKDFFTNTFEDAKVFFFDHWDIVSIIACAAVFLLLVFFIIILVKSSKNKKLKRRIAELEANNNDENLNYTENENNENISANYTTSDNLVANESYNNNIEQKYNQGYYQAPITEDSNINPTENDANYNNYSQVENSQYGQSNNNFDYNSQEQVQENNSVSENEDLIMNENFIDADYNDNAQIYSTPQANDISTEIEIEKEDEEEDYKQTLDRVLDKNILNDFDADSEPIIFEPKEEILISTKYHVWYDELKETWVIKKDDSDRVIRRVKTKEEAVKIGKEFARKPGHQLVVHKKDGEVQQTY